MWALSTCMLPSRYVIAGGFLKQLSCNLEVVGRSHALHV
jgi:hypothetical protein